MARSAAREKLDYSTSIDDCGLSGQFDVTFASNALRDLLLQKEEYLCVTLNVLEDCELALGLDLLPQDVPLRNAADRSCFTGAAQHVHLMIR
jgi:hypothetical protein